MATRTEQLAPEAGRIKARAEIAGSKDDRNPAVNRGLNLVGEEFLSAVAITSNFLSPVRGPRAHHRNRAGRLAADA